MPTQELLQAKHVLIDRIYIMGKWLLDVSVRHLQQQQQQQQALLTLWLK